jgi:hypothetical protein
MPRRDEPARVGLRAGLFKLNASEGSSSRPGCIGYNWHTSHAGIDDKTPISRLGLTEDNVLRFHI